MTSPFKFGLHLEYSSVFFIGFMLRQILQWYHAYWDLSSSNISSSSFLQNTRFPGKSQKLQSNRRGVAANDPTLLAVNHWLKEISARNSNPPLSKQSIDLNLIENESSKLLVLSLGTGQKVARYKATDAAKWGLFGWLTKDGRSPLIDILLQSSSDMSDIHEFFWFKTINMHMYLRIQEPQLGDHTSSLDLSTEENLKALKTIGSDLLANPVSSVNIETGYYEPTPEQDWKTNHDALIRFAQLLSRERKSRSTAAPSG